MITGTHILLYSKQAEADRAFFRDVLGVPFIDAGEGWLIFAMSPAELGIHPLEDQSAPSRARKLLGGELYFMCDDLDESIAALRRKGVSCSAVEAAPWGRVTTIMLPSGGSIGLYQPRHATALNLSVK